VENDHVNCIVCGSIVNIIEVEGPNHAFWKCMRDEECRENLTNQEKDVSNVGNNRSGSDGNGWGIGYITESVYRCRKCGRPEGAELVEACQC
jgi:hypothetical protein